MMPAKYYLHEKFKLFSFNQDQYTDIPEEQIEIIKMYEGKTACITGYDEKELVFLVHLLDVNIGGFQYPYSVIASRINPSCIAFEKDMTPVSLPPKTDEDRMAMEIILSMVSGFARSAFAPSTDLFKQIVSEAYEIADLITLKRIERNEA